MNTRCEFEFYFRKKDMEKLLKSNPKAEGIIIRHEIKTSKAGRKSHVNLMEVSAYALNPTQKGDSKPVSAAKKDAAPKNEQTAVIYGCPNPPGCGDTDI